MIKPPRSIIPRRVQGGSNQVVTSIEQRSDTFSLFSIDLPLPQNLITAPLKPSCAQVVAEKELVIAIIAIIRAIHAMIGALKWLARRQNQDVLSLAAAGLPGVRLSTQLKTKKHYGQHHHDVQMPESSGISVLPSPYSSRFGEEDDRMSVGNEHHAGLPATVSSRPFPVADAVSGQRFSLRRSCGIK